MHYEAMEKKKRIKERMKEFTASRFLTCIFLIEFCLSFILFLTVEEGEALELLLKPAITIQDEIVYLKDIILRESLDDICASDINETLSIGLCKSPQPGRSHQLSRTFIVMKLKNNNVDTSLITFGGAKAIDVTRASTIYTQDEMKEFISSFLFEKYEINPDGSKIILENIREDIVLPLGEYSVSVEEKRYGLKDGKLLAKLLFMSEGKVYRKKVVNIRILNKEKIVVVTRDIDAGDDIGENSVVLEERYVEYGSSICKSLDDVIGKVSTVKFVSGEYIDEKYIEEKPVIKKGDTVTAVFTQKNMTVLLKLRALEDGLCGDVIKLYCKSTNKHLFGKICSHNQVEVMF